MLLMKKQMIILFSFQCMQNFNGSRKGASGFLAHCKPALPVKVLNQDLTPAVHQNHAWATIYWSFKFLKPYHLFQENFFKL